MRRLSRARRRVVIVAAVVVTTVLVVVLLSVWRPLPERSARGGAQLDGPIHTVDVAIDRGTLLVSGTVDDALDVEHLATWRGREPEVEVSLHDGIATVAARCPWMPVLGSCETDLHVEVPEGVHLRVRSHRGSVDLQDLSGWIEVSADGNLTVSDLRSHELVAASHGGSIDVEFIDAPSRVDIDSGGGEVSLTIPGGPYEAELAGHPVVLEVPTEELAERVLHVDAGGGAITIRPPDD